MPAKPLTKSQLQEAGRLHAMFKAWQQRERERGNKEVSQEKVGEHMGFGQSAFSQYLNGKIPLNPEAAVKFAELLGCSVADFSPSVAAEIQRFGVLIPAHGASTSSLAVVDSDDIEIPQFNAGGSMGRGRLLLKDQPGLIKNWHVDHEWIRQNVKQAYTSVANLCVVTGFGDSMRGMFNPGDPLLLDRGITTVEFDGVYFFRVADEGFIKRLQRVPGEGLVAISENKAYRDWLVKPEMDFETFGRVLTVWRSEHF